MAWRSVDSITIMLNFLVVSDSVDHLSKSLPACWFVSTGNAQLVTGFTFKSLNRYCQAVKRKAVNLPRPAFWSGTNQVLAHSQPYLPGGFFPLSANAVIMFPNFVLNRRRLCSLARIQSWPHYMPPIHHMARARSCSQLTVGRARLFLRSVAVLYRFWLKTSLFEERKQTACLLSTWYKQCFLCTLFLLVLSTDSTPGDSTIYLFSFCLFCRGLLFYVTFSFRSKGWVAVVVVCVWEREIRQSSVGPALCTVWAWVAGWLSW